ncbi:hypothetical protein GCM10023339_39840 [Alloalcanivorax gelatiniphagus]
MSSVVLYDDLVSVLTRRPVVLSWVCEAFWVDMVVSLRLLTEVLLGVMEPLHTRSGAHATRFPPTQGICGERP